MPAAAALLDRLGRPGALSLGAALLPAVAWLSTGIPSLDGVTGGGLPCGRVTELAGPPSAGRTALACRIAAGATATGEVVGWVDPEDALDPEDAAAAGIDLTRTLWVRPRTVLDALRAAELLLGAGGFGLVVLDLGRQSTHAGSSGWQRLARAAERTRSTLLATATHRQAGTFAALGIELIGRRARWSDAATERLRLLDGIEARVSIARSRVGKPGGTVVVRHRART